MLKFRTPSSPTFPPQTKAASTTEWVTKLPPAGSSPLLQEPSQCRHPSQAPALPFPAWRRARRASPSPRPPQRQPRSGMGWTDPPTGIAGGRSPARPDPSTGSSAGAPAAPAAPPARTHRPPLPNGSDGDPNPTASSSLSRRQGSEARSGPHLQRRDLPVARTRRGWG